MTRKTFYKRLREVARRSEFEGMVFDYCPGRKMVRLIGPDSDGSANLCPITAVYMAQTGSRLHLWQWREAARHIGLSPEDARAIANSADGTTWGAGYSPNTQNALARAVGAE